MEQESRGTEYTDVQCYHGYIHSLAPNFRVWCFSYNYHPHVPSTVSLRITFTNMNVKSNKLTAFHKFWIGANLRRNTLSNAHLWQRGHPHKGTRTSETSLLEKNMTNGSMHISYLNTFPIVMVTKTFTAHCYMETVHEGGCSLIIRAIVLHKGPHWSYTCCATRWF